MASGSTLHYSAPDDCEDWATSGGSINIYRGYDGDITGLKAFGNDLFIFKVSSVYRISPTASFSNLNIRNVNKVNGCINHETISEGEIGDRHVLFWQSEHGIESIAPSNASTGFDPVDVSRWVKPIYDGRNVSEMDTAWGLYHTRRKEYYGFFPTGSASVPSIALIGNGARSNKPLRWTQMNKQNLTSGVVFNDGNNDFNMYVGDNSGNVYKMHDSSVSDWDGAAVNHRFHSPFYTQGSPHHMKRYGWLFVSGDKDKQQVDVRPLILRQNLTGHAGNLTEFTVTATEGWGKGEWGVEPWGGIGTVGERLRPQVASRGQGLQAIIEGNGSFRIKGIVVASKVLSDRIAA
jgi:hypothetical protein